MDHLSGLVFRRPQATLTADLWSIFAPPFSRFIARLLDGEKMAVLCREFGISRKTGYTITTATRTAAWTA